MPIDTLRASTGFQLTPLQVGPGDDAFLGFIGFVFGKSAEAKIICDHFVSDGGLLTQSAGVVHATSGKFIDWLILNYWGDIPAPTH